MGLAGKVSIIVPCGSWRQILYILERHRFREILSNGDEGWVMMMKIGLQLLLYGGDIAHMTSTTLTELDRNRLSLGQRSGCDIVRSNHDKDHPNM